MNFYNYFYYTLAVLEKIVVQYRIHIFTPAAFLISIFLVFEIENFSIKIIAATVIIYLPIFILLYVVMKNPAFNNLLKSKLNAILVIFITAHFTLQANIWAANTINQIFKISPSYFPNTKVLLTFLYIPYLIRDYLQSIYNYLIFFSGFLLCFYIMYAMVINKSIKNVILSTIKNFFLFFFLLLTISFYMTTYKFFTTKHNFIQKAASYLDFQKNWVCINNLGKNVNGVIFLEYDKVFVEHNSSMSNYFYSINDCVYIEGKNL